MYLVLLMGVTTISFVWLAALSGPVMNRQRILDGLVDLHLARDIMAVDIRKGSTDTRSWKGDGKDRIMLSTGDSDICWECRDAKLFRISGKFHPNTKTWSDKKQAVVAQGITSLQYTIGAGSDQTIKSVTITIVGKDSTCTVYALPRVGRKLV